MGLNPSYFHYNPVGNFITYQLQIFLIAVSEWLVGNKRKYDIYGIQRSAASLSLIAALLSTTAFTMTSSDSSFAFAKKDDITDVKNAIMGVKGNRHSNSKLGVFNISTGRAHAHVNKLRVASCKCKISTYYF